MDKIVELMTDFEKSFTLEQQLKNDLENLYDIKAELEDQIILVRHKLEAISEFRRDAKNSLIFLFKVEMKNVGYNISYNSYFNNEVSELKSDQEFYDSFKPIYNKYKFNLELTDNKEKTKKVKI